MKHFPLLLIALLVQACATSPIDLDRVKQSVEIAALHPDNIAYRNIENFPGKVTCGEFSTLRNAPPDSFNPFVFRANKTRIRPSREEMAVYCSPDPGRSLYQATGINYTGSHRKVIDRVRRDFHTLEAALNSYETDNFSLPKTVQGLEALVTPSRLEPKPRHFRPGGYLDSVPNDPWGRPYQYTGPGLAGGVKGSYTLLTLGADGRPGGTNENADIHFRHLQLLDHVASLSRR